VVICCCSAAAVAAPAVAMSFAKSVPFSVAILRMHVPDEVLSCVTGAESIEKLAVWV